MEAVNQTLEALQSVEPHAADPLNPLVLWAPAAAIVAWKGWQFSKYAFNAIGARWGSEECEKAAEVYQKAFKSNLPVCAAVIATCVLSGLFTWYGFEAAHEKASGCTQTATGFVNARWQGIANTVTGFIKRQNPAV